MGLRLLLGDVLFQFLLRAGWFSLATHEYAHMWGARILGVYAEIRNTELNAVYPAIHQSLGRSLLWHEHVIFYGAGGFIQAIGFALLNIRNKDAESRLVNWMIAIQGFIYGCFEALAPRAFWETGAFLGTLCASALFIGLILWKKPEIAL